MTALAEREVALGRAFLIDQREHQAHIVNTYSGEKVRELVGGTYPGGWDRFVAEQVQGGGHDATSVVAQRVGLTEPGEPLPPSVLIDRFADADQRREIDGGAVQHRGFCGLRSMTDPYGFDDGYGFMGKLGEGGWTPLPAKGDWPYNVYLKRTPPGAPPAIVNYCEGDFSLWEFPSMAAAQSFYEEIPDSES